MANRPDDKNAAVGGPGNTDTLEQAWLKANGATSDNVNTAWRQFLDSVGFTTGNNNTDLFNYLGSLGFTGALPDRLAMFWAGAGPGDVEPSWSGPGAWALVGGNVADGYDYDYTPTGTFQALQATGLTIGLDYRMSFNTLAVGGGYGSTTYMRPGDFADDYKITRDGFHSILFNAQDSNGITRIASDGIAGMATVQFRNLKIFST